MTPFEKVKAEKIHLTLTQGEVDALRLNAIDTLEALENNGGRNPELLTALQKLDAAVNQ